MHCHSAFVYTILVRYDDCIMSSPEHEQPHEAEVGRPSLVADLDSLFYAAHMLTDKVASPESKYFLHVVHYPDQQVEVVRVYNWRNKSITKVVRPSGEDTAIFMAGRVHPELVGDKVPDFMVTTKYMNGLPFRFSTNEGADITTSKRLHIEIYREGLIGHWMQDNEVTIVDGVNHHDQSVPIELLVRDGIPFDDILADAENTFNDLSGL